VTCTDCRRTGCPSVGQRWTLRLADGVDLDEADLVDLCRRHGIRRLALFGSALRDDLTFDSDIDLLVEFEPDRVAGLMGIAAIELELQALVGRSVDLRTPADLSRHFRDTVTAEARQLYNAA
jgi:predicted nucleotidyltransferase